MNLSTEKKSNLLLHLTGGLAFLLIPVFAAPAFPHIGRILHSPLALRDIVTHALLLAFFYLHYRILIPRLYFRGKYFVYSLIIIACIAITIVLPAVIPAMAHGAHHGPPPPPHHGLINRLLLNHNFYYFIIVFAFSFMLGIHLRWKTARQEKIQTELLFLKAQINPHFLFNTLNSVYSLCIEEKANQSAAAVVKVSGMMRYVLVDSKHDYTEIEKEIDYIQSYIELQRLRFGNTVNIHFTLNGNFTNQRIAPLLLIPFIENAFKYGVNPEQDSTITIDLILEGNALVLKVKNKKVAPSGNDQKMGIGIPTTVKRMDLLYPNRYKLEITDQQGIYQVLLSLTLS